jgi:STE24 endopeptidase
LRCWAGWRTKPGSYTGLGVLPHLTGGPNDALALLLFMLALPVFSFFMCAAVCPAVAPHEFQADAYAMAQTSGADLASGLLKLLRTTPPR